MDMLYDFPPSAFPPFLFFILSRNNYLCGNMSKLGYVFVKIRFHGLTYHTSCIALPILETIIKSYKNLQKRKAKKQDSSLSFPLFYNSLLWPLTATSAYVIAKMKFNSPFTMFYIACNKKFTSLTYTTSILYKIDYPWNIHP